MSAPSLLLRRGLGYPGGRFKAGFDASHPAAAGIGPGYGISAIPNNTGWVNLCNGAAGVNSGATTSAIKGSIGRAIGYTSSTSIFTTFAGFKAVQDNAFTIAAIGTFVGVNGGGIVAASTVQTALSGNYLLTNTGGAFQFGMGTNFTTITGITLVTNVPYFMAATVSGLNSTSYGVVTRLDNGETILGTVTSPGSSSASTGTYEIGANINQGGGNGSFAAFMYSPHFTSKMQLLQWAADPWSFWYPTTGAITGFDAELVATPPSGAAPFVQKYWPVPDLHFLPRNDQTWAWNQTGKIGFDKLPNRQQDWPNPTQPFRIDQTIQWSQTLMIGKDVLPIRQQDWPNSVLHTITRIDQTIAWSQTQMAGQDKLPFRQQDWPNSALHTLPRIDQTIARSQTQLLGRDGLPFRQQDWPNPVQPPPAQTWTARQTGMIGQDSLPNRQQDWPNPTQPSRIDQTVNWRQAGMIGQDKLPFRQQDWPNPIPPSRIDQTWIAGTFLPLSTVVVTFPHNQYDWPNPTQPTYHDKGWLNQGIMTLPASLPFNNYDWPNPIQAQQFVRTWTWSQFNTATGPVQVPFNQYDWPNPTQPWRLDQTWTWSQTKMTGQDALPIRQQDWKLPTQPPQLDQTWVAGFSLPLSTTIVILPHNQYDWPNPTPPPRIDQSWGWSQTKMLGQDRLPFVQTDWPNPIQPAQIDQTWTLRQVRMLGQDRLANRQQDWPNPLGHQMLYQPQRGFGSAPGINLLPPPAPPVIKVIYQKQFFATMGGMMSIPGDPPS